MSRHSHGRPPMPGFTLDYVELHPTLSDRVYRLKEDPEWFIRSNRSSNSWAIYNEPERDFPVSPAMRTQTEAMAKLLDGIAQGFYALSS